MPTSCAAVHTYSYTSGVPFFCPWRELNQFFFSEVENFIEMGLEGFCFFSSLLLPPIDAIPCAREAFFFIVVLGRSGTVGMEVGVVHQDGASTL